MKISCWASKRQWHKYLCSSKVCFKLNLKSLFLCLRWSCHKHCLRPMGHNTKQLKTPFRVKFAGIWETNWIFLDKILHPRLNVMLYMRTMKKILEAKPENLVKVEMEVHKRNIMLSKLFYISFLVHLLPRQEHRRKRAERKRKEIRPREIVSLNKIR